ncbi:DUF2442 domain-containing protein [Thiocystis violascens]|uniref:DUF2442 domain-containing protein n=1 Tax=Thiocystis violascens (strain ATCC 17096 / DSM 198 / 6111) TaxID=765911 RepID=I3Y9C5_THIV6|nr:DUF2442 domain-containing protein [Thiocystis violascens]AFL73593.1 Protein of unknown function (DUF2442) [Thiocystis violascens DSM 198]
MIKIANAESLHDRTIRLEFSDGTTGDYDLRPLIARGTEMVKPLEDMEFFQQFFLELGALCWPNGFELSGGGIQRRLREQGMLRPLDQVA